MKPQNQTTKAIIFDSGTLISFVMSGLTGEFEKLKGIFKGKFIITEEVKKEVIDTPLNIKRFELEALKINRLLSKGIIEMPSALGFKSQEISAMARKALEIANNTYVGNGKDIHIIDSAEASCVALSKMMKEKGIDSAIAIDERTMRMLGERPENLGKLLEKRLHAKINFRKENFEFFRGLKFIRSSELVFVAYKKGLVDLKGKDVLDALLYGVKTKGCAISGDEISEIKRMV